MTARHVEERAKVAELHRLALFRHDLPGFEKLLGSLQFAQISVFKSCKLTNWC